MRYTVFFLMALGLALLQAVVLGIFSIANAIPDFLLICLCIAALTFELKWVLVSAVLLGLLKDTFSTFAFGINIPLFVLFGCLIFWLSRKIFIEDNYSRIVLTLAAVFSYHLILFFVYVLFGRPVPFSAFLRIGLLESLYSALVFPAIYYIFMVACFKKQLANP